jgi:predicted nucleic-acid-binding Zn-ribbon protein
MNTEPCPKCDSTQRERGELFPKGSLWDVRFKTETASELSFKKHVIALACSSCGYIELYLAGDETKDPS